MMNTSSSLEISTEILEKSFLSYENDTSKEDIRNSFTLNEIDSTNGYENPVKTKINELAKLQVKKKLSGAALNEIIPILNNVPGASIEIPQDKRYVQKNTEMVFETKYYGKCLKCKDLVLCDVECDKCGILIEKKKTNYFIYIPVGPQIKKSLVENFEEIRDYVNRPRNGNITDIDDGKIQKELIAQNPDKTILSFTLNIDGGVISEKSSKSLWPIQLYQNYLPPIKRYLTKNILLVGLYYDNKKPDPFELLFPLLQDFQQLHNGVQLVYDGILYDFLPILLFCTCDLPARCSIQNFKYLTGTEACPICLHPGHKNTESGRIMYRYTKEAQQSKLRTHRETIQHATNNKCGVKGMSCLMALSYFDIIRCTPTDSMHNIFLGAFKKLLSIWLGDTKIVNSKFKPISKQYQIELNKRLSLLKPYARITYKPRSLDYRAKFRAVEYKYLMFYYLRYAAANFIEKKYIDHFELLSASIYMLSKSNVNENEIKVAQQMLNEFSDKFEIFFGKDSITMNIHLLRHYAFNIENCGPLWTHSAFGFESNMGVLTSYSSSGFHVIDQIAKKYIMSNFFSNEQPESTPKFAIMKNNFHNEYDEILNIHGFNTIDGKCDKVKVNQTIYKSIFCKETKSIDHFIATDDGTIGAVVYFIIKNSDIYALVKVYETIQKKFHLIEIKPENRFTIVPFENIKHKLIYLTFGSIEVVTSEPNKFEKI